jgi:hypothetical protein
LNAVVSTNLSAVLPAYTSPFEMLSFFTFPFLEKSMSFKLTQKIFGVSADSKKYILFLWSETVLHLVEEIFGSPGVLIPKGTEQLRMTLKTLAIAMRISSVCGIALM